MNKRNVSNTIQNNIIYDIMNNYNSSSSSPRSRYMDTYNRLCIYIYIYIYNNRYLCFFLFLPCIISIFLLFFGCVGVFVFCLTMQCRYYVCSSLCKYVCILLLLLWIVSILFDSLRFSSILFDSLQFSAILCDSII